MLDTVLDPNNDYGSKAFNDKLKRRPVFIPLLDPQQTLMQCLRRGKRQGRSSLSPDS
jgi:hypothetical protein